MKYLKTDSSFEEAMSEVLLQGGDTDTNAAIMGMILGAKFGFSQLNTDMLKKVETYTTLKGGHKRPDFLIPGKGMLKNLTQFLSNLPKKLII